MSNLREKILSLEPNSNTGNQTALVDGIYITSQAVRKQALSFIWAKYNMLPDNLTQSLGRLYDAVEEIYLPDKNEKSLFNYTHDKTSVYSRSIAEKNLTVKDGNVQRSVTETPRDAYNSWYGTAYQGKNYHDIINEYEPSFSGAINVTYNDTTLTAPSSDYNYIDYVAEQEREFAELTASTQRSKDKLKSLKRPKKKDYNEEEYKDVLKDWRDAKNKQWRQQKRDAKDQYRENLEAQNSFIREPKTLIDKTSKLFKENKIDSLVSRLHSEDSGKEFIDTSKTPYGKSRGRNLAKFNPDYANPFCRTWAAHKQYGKDKFSPIRPFSVSGKTFEESELIRKFRAPQGGAYLHDYSVLNNGFIRMTPEVNEKDSNYNTKRCMFSIENLAWKDVDHTYHLSEEQRGPNGGRIMWFPPYDLQFQENSQATWNETNFIGRGEPIYTYTNTKRTGSLSFTLLIDHPSIINEFENRSDNEKDKNNEDNDILRFFAGCDIPMKLKNTSDESLRDEYGNESITETETNKESSEVTVNVYFPYGYSGNMNTGGDTDWSDYLFYGFNVDGGGINKDYARGYEIRDRGITNDNINKGFCKCNENHFYYRVDESFTCKEKYDKNELNDKNSYGLNNTFKNENEMSFADLYMVKFLLNIKEKGEISNDDEDVIEYAKEIKVLKNITSIKDGKIENEDKIFRNKNAQALYNNGGLGDYHLDLEFEVSPNEVLTNNEKSKDNFEISEKRASKVKSLITDLDGRLVGNSATRYVNEEYKKYKDTFKEKYVNKNVNNRKSKEWRRVTAKIKYNLPNNELTSPTVNNEYDKGVTANTENIINDLIRVTGVTQYPDYNEGDYFKNLVSYDNYAYKKISERIKYFDPTYHSISPEGFNSRLTFLHQCTRQGHTLERSENAIENIYSTAGNMAFGRPPFCVLRIGDFINTKIVIRSLNIVYQNGNGMQWDMNPEGIGVQPMFAKVTMQIEIIGGQSLDAPVSRLNNAVSFNYYANTGVYDNRADRAIYNGTGITYSDLYEPQRIDNTASNGETQNT